MAEFALFGASCFIGEDRPPPSADNENLRLHPNWKTPAEFMQWLRQDKRRLEQELAADGRLWSCPVHRLDRDINRAMERCARWHCYGER